LDLGCSAVTLSQREIVENCACHKVRMAARAVTRTYDDILRPTGLRATQFSVLVAIAVDGAMSIAALTEFLGMDRSTLTRNLQPLQKDGLVRIGAEGWRRSRTLEITDKGRQRVRAAMPLWEKAQKILMGKLGARNGPAVLDGLDHLIRAA
jgi:DNA-binding MarR family transcriptional regulator